MLDEFRLDRGLANGHAFHSALKRLVLLLEMSGVCEDSRSNLFLLSFTESEWDEIKPYESLTVTTNVIIIM